MVAASDRGTSTFERNLPQASTTRSPDGGMLHDFRVASDHRERMIDFTHPPTPGLAQHRWRTPLAASLRLRAFCVQDEEASEGFVEGRRRAAGSGNARFRDPTPLVDLWSRRISRTVATPRRAQACFVCPSRLGKHVHGCHTRPFQHLFDQLPLRGSFSRGGLTMIDYTWVAWFEELAAKIAEGGEGYLIERARNVAWQEDGREGVPALLRYGDENIDPFSFLYFLAHKNTRNQYNRVFESVHEKFSIGSDFPETAFIPTPTRNLLFHGGPNTFNPEVLWRLYRQAVRIDAEPAIQPGDFNAALGIYNVGIPKLTQTLFIANPRYFLPADRGILAVLPEHEDVNDYGGYVAVMEGVKNRFPGCHPYEINTFLYTQASNSPLVSMESSFSRSAPMSIMTALTTGNGTMNGRKKTGTRPSMKNNYVYTGGPGQTRIYPLAEPRRGDVISGSLRRPRARYRRGGKGTDTILMVGTKQRSFKSTGSTRWPPRLRVDFHKLDSPTRESQRVRHSATPMLTTITFDLIDRWIGDGGVEPSPDPEPPAAESDTSFPPEHHSVRPSGHRQDVGSGFLCRGRSWTTRITRNLSKPRTGRASRHALKSSGRRNGSNS